MSTVDLLAARIIDKGVELVASLPDSWIGPLLDRLDSSEVNHVRVAREDEGVALVAGAALGGCKALLICQNAGLLLSVNALAGYAAHHSIPVPIIAALRGGPDDGYYYQAYKGRATERVLDAIDVPSFVVDDPDRVTEAARVLDMASLHRRPAVALLTRSVLVGGAR